MIRCPNCGESNEPGSRFCFNCGANLAAFDSPPQPPPEPPRPPVPPPSFPPPAVEPHARSDHGYDPRFPPPPPDTSRPPSQPALPPQYPPPGYPSGPPHGQSAGWGGPPGQPSGWAALDQMDPPPPPKKRATWLMVMLGIIAGCLLVCVGTFVYALTPAGQDTFEEVGTVLAEFATEAAPEPTRSP